MAERILMHTGLVVTATAYTSWLAGDHLPDVVVLSSIVEVPAKRWVRQLLTPRPLPVASAAAGTEPTAG